MKISVKLISGILAVVVIAAIVIFFMSQAEKAIKIGAVLSISGPASYVGEEVKGGMLLAVDEINSWGGINGKKIELIIGDSKTSTQKGEEAFSKIEATHHPVLYVSTLSSVSMALAPLAEENEVVLVGLVVTNPKLTEQNEWVFRYYATAEAEVPPILSMLEELKVKKLGILYLNDDYGTSVFELLKKEFERTGGIVRGKTFEAKDSDFKKQIAKLKDMEAIYSVGFDSNLKNVFKQLKKENFSGFILGPATATLPSVRSMPEANGVYVAAPIIYNPNYLFAKEVKEKYETEYNRPFNHYAANGYDLIKLLAGLLEDKEISRESVKSLLEDGFIYPGVFGNLDVKRGEHGIAFLLDTAQIVDGEVKYLR
ncbi:MAG: ABC transporter substrate-binding protein [Deltaproteobacteria bacterium]|nr:ABC transporter substrate-binding protein [Deltaproteobacteria bacterium]